MRLVPVIPTLVAHAPFRPDKGYVSFSFVDRSGEIYAGEGVGFGLVRPPELARVVLYATRKPELNKIGVCLLFHRLVIIGRGLTDLDKAEAAARRVLAKRPLGVMKTPKPLPKS